MQKLYLVLIHTTATEHYDQLKIKYLSKNESLFQ